MISRVVPRPEPDPLVIVAEDYNEWTARAEAFRGEKPAALTALELVDNQTARLERKLFIHNGGHAVCGYFGFHRGHQYIHEAVADPVVAEHLGAWTNWEPSCSGNGVSRRSRSTRTSRTSAGGARSPKCATKSCAWSATRSASSRRASGWSPRPSWRSSTACPAWIVKAIVAALRYRHPQDPQSLELAERLNSQGLSRVLQEICHLDSDAPLAAAIESAWNR